MAQEFGRSILDEIRERISIASYIGECVSLKRAGRNFKGLCPFHNEKTPSFMVSDDKGIFHCFGCGEGGDIFKFAMKFEGLGFFDTVKVLATRAGVELPRDADPKIRAEEDEKAKRRRYYLRINEIARDYFISRLLDVKAGERARAYLQHRGISGEISTQHFLGSADKSFDSLVSHLEAKGVPLEMAAELGLLKKREKGGYYDFFRDRLMFPIMSSSGEVLGFSGRDIGGEAQVAKYVNSPDSALYHKSSSVFGLNAALNAVRSSDHVVLVEGNMDLISLHQAGITNVVAPLGTALTEGHLRLLKRYTRNMTLVFDGDSAGIKAAMRSLELFIEVGLSPRVVPMPKGEDPDSLIKKEGSKNFMRRIENAIPLFEFFVDQVISSCGADASGKVEAVSKVVPLLQLVTSPAERAIYRRFAARKLDMDEGALELSAKGAGKNATGRLQAVTCKAMPSGAPAGCVLMEERLLIEIILKVPSVAEKIFGELSSQSFADPWCRTVAGLVESEMKDGSKFRFDKLVGNLEDALLADQLRQVVLGPERWTEEEIEGLVKDCVEKMKKRSVILRIERINSEIRRAENEGDDAGVMKLLEEKKKLTTQKVAS